MKNIKQIEINNVFGGRINEAYIILNNKKDFIGYSGKMGGHVDLQDGELTMYCDANEVLMNTTGFWNFDCDTLVLVASTGTHYGKASILFKY